ncbi:hypothetical protein AS189_16365 [Arthrobacter alpinus]|uniref:Signal peptidase I n=1 Tax=Arthrobacter alpinus TaxID=656366 RepID=A0A0S2M1X4_9MICC|nr:S26 family signal peptidase [Arthrobacter alpinus]ALO67763.1 hypothetical protein AS189_16365 [Arthrobacter alpinus]
MPGPDRGALVDRWLFNIGAVLGALCLVLAGLTLAFGLKPLIFSSGSMGPAIPTRSLALAVPAASAEISPGEVVSVVTRDGVRVTHRVGSADPSIGLVLKGDANAVADLQPYTGPSVDRVLFSVPGLGYVASWFASPWALVLGGLLCAYLIYAAFFRAGPGGTRKSHSGRDSGNSSTGGEAVKPGTHRRIWLGIGATAAVVAIVVPLGAAARVESTQAAWTASAAAEVQLATTTMNPATNLRCANPTTGLGRDTKVDFSWDAPAAGLLQLTGYKVSAYVQEPGGGPPAAEKISSDRLPASTRTLTLDQIADNGLLGNLLGAILGGLLGPNYNLKITFTLSAEYEHGWVSAPLAHTTVNATSKGVLGPLLPTRKLSCTLQ